MFKVKLIIICAFISTSGLNAATVNIINHTGKDLQLVERYISVEDGKVHYYYSECSPPVTDDTFKSLTFAGGSRTSGSNNVKSAAIYEYTSSDGTCSTSNNARFWPTYYQAEQVLRFKSQDLVWNKMDDPERQKIHYTVLQNSQDTQAQKSAPVVVVNLRGKKNPKIDLRSPYSFASYGYMGALYYIPSIDENGVFINDSNDVANPGAISAPFNDNVYINNTYLYVDSQWQYPTTLLIK